MGYDQVMDARKSSLPAPPADDGWTDTPITDAEWEAMPEAERQAILKAEAELDRGEWFPGEVVLAELREMAARHRARGNAKPR